MVLIKDPSLYLSSRWNKFLVSLLISIQYIVSVSGRFSPLGFEMFSISPLQAYLFVVGFPTTPFDPSPKDAFKLIRGRRYCFLLCSFHYIFSSLFRRHCDISFFNHHPVLSKFIFFSLAYHIIRSVVPFVQVLFALSSLASLFNRSAVRICYSLLPFPTGLLSILFFLVPLS